MLRAQNPEEGFVSLFDGKSLQGWQIEEGPESAYYVSEGSLVVAPHCASPTWLRSEREFENFDLRGEFLVRGWTDSGVYFHAPRHGRPTWAGFQLKLFHQVDKDPTPQSMGAIFPVLAPSKVNVHKEWNDFRILIDWPVLRVWANGEIVQDLNLESHPGLRYRLRSGYLGFPAVSASARFRNLRIRELPSREEWTTLFASGDDFAKWAVSEGKPDFRVLGDVLRADGVGHLATREEYRDFELQLYVRGSNQHNGGILFRSAGEGLKNPRHYEIQLHDVEEAHFPTGSLYYFKRSVYPRIEAGKWFLMQLLVQGKWCLVRIDGENVMEYDQLENLDEGHIELQAHRAGYWTEFKRIRIRPL